MEKYELVEQNGLSKPNEEEDDNMSDKTCNETKPMKEESCPEIITSLIAPEDIEYNEYYLECGGVVHRSKTAFLNRILKHKRLVKIIPSLIITAAYFVYFSFSMYHSFGDEESVRLVLGTIFGLFIFIKSKYGNRIGKAAASCAKRSILKFPRMLLGMRWLLYVVAVVFVVTYLSTTVVKSSPENLISVGGMAVFIVIGYVISKHPDRVNWHAVFWGIGTQVFFALLILRTTHGYKIFSWMGERIEEFLRHTDKASVFIFGDSYRDHYFAFAAMPLIISMSATVNVLYHYGVLQALVANFGFLLTKCLGTSAVESVSTALSMFLGPPECPLAIKPFITLLTSSELHAVMAANFASVSGSMFGMLLSFGVPANHLLAASVMSVPAALAMSKLIVPETRYTRIQPKDAYTVPCAKYSSVVEAMSVGAVDGITLVGTVVVNQLIFIAAIDFLDGTLQWFGARVGYSELTFALICSYLFYPFSYLMGFSDVDLYKIGELLGIKIFANSFVGFYEFGKLILNRKALETYILETNGTWHWDSGNIILDYTNKTLAGGILTRRSEVIGTYALCGLNHLGAIGVTLGVMTALAPERNLTINKYVLRANITGQIACFLTACIAGLLYDRTVF